jgi:Protein of unknown function (DUF3800)
MSDRGTMLDQPRVGDSVTKQACDTTHDMKLCYVDESGNQPTDPCLVMVGVLADAIRLHRTREEFGEIFDEVEGFFTDSLKEIKGAKMLSGRDRWRKIDPENRKRIAEKFCGWLKGRKHHIALSAVDRKKHDLLQHSLLPDFCGDPWLMAATHIALQVQKVNQSLRNNKGVTFLIFDENKAKADTLAELLWDPPAWTDDYYGKKKKEEGLDQLIDSAFTVKSHHAGLVQVADVFAFIVRPYCELRDFGHSEEWTGETQFLGGCVEVLKTRLIPRAARWPSKTTSDCAKCFNFLAPKSLLSLDQV